MVARHAILFCIWETSSELVDNSRGAAIKADLTSLFLPRRARYGDPLVCSSATTGQDWCNVCFIRLERAGID